MVYNHPTVVNMPVDLGKAANFPYATINPEEARIPVPDLRFDWLCETYKPASRVPAFLTCIDIAGLTAVSFKVCRCILNFI
jgi:ribosome-binding ATPase YchF (GTP1/OBG family)